MTVGDNLYPKDARKPTEEEFDKMMKLFTSRKAIANLDIYPIRGNHDCYFDSMSVELNLHKKYPTWKMPYFYYEKLFDIGQNKKFSLLQLDSCFLLCESVGKTKSFAQLDHDTQLAYMI